MKLSDRAIAYCEKYGIVEAYQTKPTEMFYYESFPIERATVKTVVNLEDYKETRKHIKGYFKPYKSKIGGKYYANWC